MTNSLLILFFVILMVLCLHNCTGHGPHHKHLKPPRPQHKGDSDLLVRALKGEKVERTPVWLMRQVKHRMLA